MNITTTAAAESWWRLFVFMMPNKRLMRSSVREKASTDPLRTAMVLPSATVSNMRTISVSTKSSTNGATVPRTGPAMRRRGDSLPVDWNAVYNMIPNPKMSMFGHEPRLLAKMREFNRLYTKLLANIDKACNGKPEVLMDGVPMMHAMRLAAVDLMKEPSGVGDYTAGPSFEIVP